MFLVIGISSSFVLSCFATGCHTSDLKIATAALRPRNDTKLRRFCLENRRFSFLSVIFCAVSLRIVFQTFRSGICSVFPQNPPDLSLRGGRNFCARRGNLKRSNLPFRNELWLRRTKQSLEIKKEEARQRSESMFFVIGLPSCFVLPCFATGCHTSNFQIATAALRPRNDTKMVGFAIKPTIFVPKMFEIRATLRRTSKGVASERRAAPVRVSRGRSAGAYRAALLTGSIFRAGYSGRRGCREFRRSRRRICRAARPARCARRPRSPRRARSRRSRPDRRR